MQDQSTNRTATFEEFRTWYIQNEDSLKLRKLLSDKTRNEKLVLNHGDLLVDFTKQNINEDVLTRLEKIYTELGIQDRIKEFFSGKKINTTENRPVLHTALRLPEDAKLEVEGVDVVPEVHNVLKRIEDFSRKIRGI